MKSIDKQTQAHTLRQWLRCCMAVAAALAVPDLALAASTDTIVDGVDNINILLAAVGVGVATIAWTWGGFKMLFGGARLQDVGQWFIGGAVVGGAAGLAAWSFG